MLERLVGDLLDCGMIRVGLFWGWWLDLCYVGLVMVVDVGD